MDDYATLVERVCFTLPKVRGCLLLSADGLVLSAYPEDGSAVTETAWLHFCAMGEAIRGFLAFEDQVWAYVRHGAYAAFVVTDSGVRPGVLVDQLEQVLTTSRISLPSGTSHVAEAPAPAAAPPAEIPARLAEPPAPPAAPEVAELHEPAEEPEEPDASAGSEEPAEPPEGSWRPVPVLDRADDEDGEIDRVQLAQEFSGLLQMHRADDEASS
jgi:hypothetical protein